MTSPITNTVTHEPFNQFNFNFEVLKLIEEVVKIAAINTGGLKAKIMQRKIEGLWDSVEREMLRQLQADDEAERKRYDI